MSRRGPPPTSKLPGVNPLQSLVDIAREIALSELAVVYNVNSKVALSSNDILHGLRELFLFSSVLLIGSPQQRCRARQAANMGGKYALSASSHQSFSRLTDFGQTCLVGFT